MNYVNKITRALGRKVTAQKLKRGILKEQLFSPEWYLEAYPDVAKAGVDPYTHYLEFGWREGRNPSRNFHTDSYLAANPDVRDAGVNPLLHYVLCGKAEGRLAKIEAFRSQTYRKLPGVDGHPDGFLSFQATRIVAAPDNNLPDKIKIAFLIGTLQGESKRYRVFNVIEAIQSRNMEAAYFYDVDIPGKAEEILAHDLIVLFRYPWSGNVESLISRARARRVPLVYDVDDYIFDPAIASSVDGVRMLPESERALYLNGVLRYRKCLENCDYATAPTEFLARMQTAFVNKAYVIANTMNAEQLRIGQEVLRELSNKPEGRVTLGYFSGTLTHQKDFAQAYPSLVRILDEFPSVELFIKGEFNLDEFPELARYGNRVRRAPFSDWKELPRDIRQVDINLVPLEPNNLFCESKSELKYFEAAMLGIPSVMPELGPYKYVIEHEHNGLLAQTADDWYECLKRLITDTAFRKNVGQAAREHALKTYIPENLARNADAVYRDVLDDYRKRQRRTLQKKSLSISFIAPPPKPGSGGHKDIFLLSNVLCDLGNEVNIYFLPDRAFASVAQIEDAVFNHFVEPKFNCMLGTDIAPCDALFATHYSTAYHVQDVSFKARKVFYFVQDYEPYFHPVNEDYIRAARTYSMGFHCITLGPWLQEMLRHKHGCDAEAVPFWIEREIYYPRPRTNSGKPKLVFLARPEMPRRCFNLGVEALNVFHKLNPEVEIVLFGSTETKKLTLPFKHTDLGVVHKTKLGALYAEMRAGLIFSPTNPSFVPYEMMASGCPVVDVSMDKEFDYLKYGSHENAILTAPDPNSIAQALNEVILNEAKREALITNAFAFVNQLPSVEQAGETLARLITQALAGS